MQRRIHCVIMRGGTSRALFFRREDLPVDIAAQDRILLAALGNPDPSGRLVNGLGGPISSTSKVAIISARRGEPDTVDYTFGQGGHASTIIDRGGNCGNISSAVGPYAIDEGLVEVREPETRVRIYNTNTDKYIIAHVPTEGGKAKVAGDYRIAGVPGAGAPISLVFEAPGGTRTGRLLPTGRPQEILETACGPIAVSIIDAANPFVFVRARDLGLAGTELPDQLDADQELVRRLEGIRAAAAIKIGLARDYREATERSPSVPKIALVSPAAGYRMTTGETIPVADVDLVARMISLGRAHGAYPITGAVGTAGAAGIEGTLVREMIPRERLMRSTIRIGHPSGSVEVEAKFLIAGDQCEYLSAVVYRTARRLMDGHIYLPTDARLA
ncbi:MAG: PrpF domain-containing protein [Smithellaceae bacterium]|nr:PrpF domain-containing protein [Smithellaceae bacterium]